MPGRLFIIFAILFCCNCHATAGNYNYTYDAECARAYKSYMSLHLAEGHAAIIRETLHDPYNLMAVYITDYEDCLLLMLNGNPADYEGRKDHFEERLDILNKGSDNNPWYRLCKAGIYQHWAFVNMRMGDNIKAAIKFRKSYLLIQENERLYPGFAYNRVFTGLQQTLVGTIPSNYKWIASIFGLKGDVKKGINMLTTFVDTHTDNDPLYAEAVLYNIYLKYYLFSKQDEVWQFLNSSQFSVKDNLLNGFVKANLAISYRKAETAIETIKSEEVDKDYSQYPAFDFEMGNALFLKSDPACIGYFQRFLNVYKGGRFVKDALHQVALMYYLEGNMQQAGYYRNMIKDKGTQTVDADKQAERFAEDTRWPNAVLLQSRLLIDGGYYEAALKKLAVISMAGLKTQADRIEYYFRMGRAYDEKGTDARAIYYYQYTINTGRNSHEYFAARAALQMGYLYERTGKIKEAINMYTEALDMRDHDYQASIDQQAKAGINRLSAH